MTCITKNSVQGFFSVPAGGVNLQGFQLTADLALNAISITLVFLGIKFTVCNQVMC